jgi:hypothetical protein
MIDATKLVVKNPPFPKQVECLEKGYGKEYFAVLMDPGCGKTYVTIVEAANLFLEGKIDFVFIVAPSGVEVQWAREEIPKHCPVPFETFVWEDLNTEKAKRAFKNFYLKESKTLKFFLVRIDSFSRPTYMRFCKSVVTGKQTYLAVDEASTIKNPTSQRTYNLMYLLNTAMNIEGKEVDLWRAKEKGNGGMFTKIEQFVASAKYRRILTGSLVTVTPYNAWAPFQFLKYNFFGTTYEGFRARHGIEIREKGLHDKEYRRLIRRDEMERVFDLQTLGNDVEFISEQLKITETSVKWILEHPDSRVPYKNLERLKIEIEPHSFTCTLEDIVHIDVVDEVRMVEMTTEQKRIYKQTEDDMLSNYGDKTLTVVSKLALLTKLCQITSGYFPADDIVVDEDGEVVSKRVDLVHIGKSNAKVQALIDELEEHNFEKPVVLFSRFTEEIQMVHCELSKTYPSMRWEMYYGATPESKRNEIKSDFINGKVDGLVSNPQIAGIGLNLQRANFAWWHSYGPSFEKRKQGNGRVIRSGQNSAVLIKSAVCEKTIDVRLMEILKSKESLADYFSSRTIAEFLGR